MPRSVTNNLGTFRQSGATLIVSLVILAVVTLLGVASMRASNLELRMAASARDRSIAFQAAETALITVEKELSQSPPPYTTPDFLPSCNTGNCFTAACTNGLCFSGDFVGAQTYSDCQLAKSDNTMTNPWQDKTKWDTAASHKVLNVAGTSGSEAVNTVKYLIEFLCYAPVDDKVDSPATAVGASGWVPLFRITTRAEGESGRASVMLQAVVQAANQ